MEKERDHRRKYNEQKHIHTQRHYSFIFPSPLASLQLFLLGVILHHISPRKRKSKRTKKKKKPINLYKRKRRLKIKHHGLLFHSSLSRSTQLAAGNFNFLPFNFRSFSWFNFSLFLSISCIRFLAKKAMKKLNNIPILLFLSSLEYTVYFDLSFLSFFIFFEFSAA